MNHDPISGRNLLNFGRMPSTNPDKIGPNCPKPGDKVPENITPMPMSIEYHQSRQ